MQRSRGLRRIGFWTQNPLGRGVRQLIAGVEQANASFFAANGIRARAGQFLPVVELVCVVSGEFMEAQWPGCCLSRLLSAWRLGFPLRQKDGIRHPWMIHRQE